MRKLMPMRGKVRPGVVVYPKLRPHHQSTPPSASHAMLNLDMMTRENPGIPWDEVINLVQQI